jgi:hypothetical protein
MARGRALCRWSDEELGDWNNEEQVAQLPQWFRDQLAEQPPFERDNWMDGLHDREWQIAGMCPCGSGIKVDLCWDGLPLSSWPLRFVIELSGGAVIYDSLWRTTADVAQALNEPK